MMSDKPATQADIEKLDQKIRYEIKRLDQKIDRVAAEMIRRFDSVVTKDDLASIHGQLNGMTNTLDFISGRSKEQERTIVVYDQILKGHRIQLTDHQQRIGALESKS